jgi:small multidrug resistance family-3 protein
MAAAFVSIARSSISGPQRMTLVATAGLFVITAVMEIVGCFLPYLWLRGKTGPWVLLPAAVALAAFVWLLSLHPTAAGRTYAAYGGVYVATAIVWLWLVDGVRPSAHDLVGSAVAVLGMGIIMWGAPQRP